MTIMPERWTESTVKFSELIGEPIARAFGWVFFEHPKPGDESTILAVTLDRIGDNGPIVYDTQEFELPDYL